MDTALYMQRFMERSELNSDVVISGLQMLNEQQKCVPWAIEPIKLQANDGLVERRGTEESRK